MPEPESLLSLDRSEVHELNLRARQGDRQACVALGNLWTCYADKGLVGLLCYAPAAHPPCSIGMPICLRPIWNPTECATRGERIATGRESRPRIVADSGAHDSARRNCPPGKFGHAAVFNRQTVPSIDSVGGSAARQGSQ